MSKLSFRARALDAAKPLPIYRNKDLPDLNDCVSINRAVPQMPTGMEKEEESEHHLQRAISAQSVFREKKENMVIPVPEAESNITYYDRLYKGELRIPKQLFHIQPLGLDNEQPDYDMDSEDETLLNRLNRKMEIKPIQFETMVDRLEKASANQLVTITEAKLLLNEDDYLLKSVYDYWVRKRKNCRGPSLIPLIRSEKRDGSTNNDAYVAFRRRTEKMQTRKNRKNDEASYEKMLKLRREFSRTVTILEMIKRREKSKRELLHLTLEVVEKRYQMGDFTGEVLSEVTAPLAEKPVYTAPITLTNGNRHNHKAEIKIKTHKSGSLQHHGYHHVSVKDEDPFDFIRPKKKYTRREPLCRPGRPAKRQHIVNKADIKQYDFHSSGEEDYPLSPPSEPDEENDPDGTFAFRRKAGCHYLAPCVDQSSGLLWDHPELAGLDALRHRQSLTALSVPQRCVGLARRRVGRGGRVLLDRASSDLDGVLKQLDSAVFSSSFPRGLSAAPEFSDPQVPSQNHRTMPGSASSLADILSNIQALRWRYFRPRPTQCDGSGEGRTGRPSMDNRLSGGLFVHTKNSGSGGITEEQYQTHQQALAQMQKQQLAQLQLKAPPPQQHFSLPERQHTQTAGSTDCIISKTLDSASAHFAASAVISAPGQVNNENKPDNTSVNGVVQPSGTSRPPHSTSTSQGGTGLDRSGRTTSCGGPLLPASHSTTPQSLPNHWGHGSAVSPAHHHHNSRPSAPSPSALKLATMAASSLDRVPKVTPAIGSMARDNHEPERLALNGISETTVPMEVT
ncbi:enhancer of polycomb homolog 2-like isoform X1 [Coregonus clupeaformis]|uniref:enhancer of polycomb homolog 2-like isoform X1 n=1 Tax=Coregonus clupeaformis TaxID=59861 RepID=UPI001E1C2C5A|nr:enhancer of polycomb homolog 2-like isoform X1 [Coregonus clupeaformis]